MGNSFRDRRLTTLVTIDKADFDGYEHLNNAEYPRYFELGRKAFSDIHGLNEKSMLERKLKFIAVKQSYEHKDEFNGDKVEIETIVEYNGKARILMHQKMKKGEVLIATGEAEYCFKNLSTGKPIRPPEDIIKLIFG